MVQRILLVLLITHVEMNIISIFFLLNNAIYKNLEQMVTSVKLNSFKFIHLPASFFFFFMVY